MKRSFPLAGYCLLVLSIFLSCSKIGHHGDNISISISETADSYKMSADFNEDQSRKVLEYMDKRLGNRNNFSFVNTQADATITLDDRTKIYMKSSPGYLKIILNKEENSTASYLRVKKMCEGIKDILANKQNTN